MLRNDALLMRDRKRCHRLNCCQGLQLAGKWRPWPFSI